uniref:Uncharacterized protein n=1 Tax=Candidatus Kentrum sp. FW TaxID=2126338 RepID=A0A450TWW4_9GAMM|nr:MAG: hypothetical protein BECKFW1821C_GA0114237_105318 [Candidatus Kentron sp. FW]
MRLPHITNTIRAWICWPRTEDNERIVDVRYLSEMAYLKRLTYSTAKTIVENLKLG